MKVKCALGDEEIDSDGYGVFQRVTGWAEKRKSGGANAVRNKTLLHEFCCREHLDLETKRGISARQEGMF